MKKLCVRKHGKSKNNSFEANQMYIIFCNNKKNNEQIHGTQYYIRVLSKVKSICSIW